MDETSPYQYSRPSRLTTLYFRIEVDPLHRVWCLQSPGNERRSPLSAHLSKHFNNTVPNLNWKTIEVERILLITGHHWTSQLTHYDNISLPSPSIGFMTLIIDTGIRVYLGTSKVCCGFWIPWSYCSTNSRGSRVAAGLLASVPLLCLCQLVHGQRLHMMPLVLPITILSLTFRPTAICQHM